ncbi:hypothetical protein [Cupriavidus metallidurans]|uniref:hypothetical protein n=1 Tax=Cupriavidus metallidurans TaxID=119219 RepID=UPI0004636787|nr:hypothetical protein [Cupriavidus metallidurans]
MNRDAEPFVRSCECCRAFRRRDDGLPICLTPARSYADVGAQRIALAGANARNRCAMYAPIDNLETDE